MSKISTQVIHNLKKGKGSFVSFGLIVLFTAFMLNLALVLAFQVDEAYDARFDELMQPPSTCTSPKCRIWLNSLLN